MIEKSYTVEQVAEVQRCREMLPGERQAYENNPAGHRRFHTVDGAEVAGENPATGRYEWANAFTSNEHGKLTRQAEGAIEMFAPFREADNARFAKIQAETARIALRDTEGHVHYVEPEKADDDARRNGWGHHWRARGLVLRTGLDGRMEFRRVGRRGEWEPTGYLLKWGERREVDRMLAVLDPDGAPWWHDGHAWRLM